MSEATTNQQALAEFVGDLKRLNPTRDGFLSAVDASAAQLQENSQLMKRQIAEAWNGYLAKNKVDVDAHVDSEIAAKEATRSSFDVKADAKALTEGKK